MCRPRGPRVIASTGSGGQEERQAFVAAPQSSPVDPARRFGIATTGLLSPLVLGAAERRSICNQEPSPMTSFPELIAARRRGDHATTFEVTENWLQGRTSFGGLIAAYAVQAMRD